MQPRCSRKMSVELDNLYVGDCVRFMNDEMDEESVDLVVTSPPYDKLRNYNGYAFDAEAVARVCGAS